MPNGRSTQQRIGDLSIESGQAAVLDPLVFGDLLGVDRATARRVLHDLVESRKAVQWQGMGGTYEVWKNELDSGGVTYEVRF